MLNSRTESYTALSRGFNPFEIFARSIMTEPSSVAILSSLDYKLAEYNLIY